MQSLVSEIDRLAAESVTETRIDAAVAGETAFFDRPVDSGGGGATQANSLYWETASEIGWKEAKDTCGANS